MAEFGDSGAARARQGSEAWAALEVEQRRAWLRTTFRQRLEWLEQAKRFAAVALAAARKRRGGE